jgi:hypothetical protein
MLLAMPDEPQAPPSKIDMERTRQVYSDLRESYQKYLDSCAKAYDQATDLNKQSSTLYERVFLLNTGILGFSITSLTAVASRFHVEGFFKFAIALLVGVAWVGLLLSTVFCVSLILESLASNRKLYAEWLNITFTAHTQNIVCDAERLARITASFLREDPNDRSTQLLEVAGEIRQSMGSKEWPEHLQAISKSRPEDRTGAERWKYAVRFLQVAILLLGVAAMLLFVSSK